MKIRLIATLIVSLLFVIPAYGFTSENLYEDVSDDTASFGPNKYSIDDLHSYHRTLEEVRDATVLVSMDTGFGSGIVITPEGLILTNYHIIHGAKTKDVKIWFYAADELGYYTVDLVGIDPFADLALLQINNIPEHRLPLTYLLLQTDGNALELAQEVWAIGHPLGMQWTVTRGVINSYERSSFITAYVRLIQHTSLIQKGNSGGPLVDKDGRVVGVNTYVTKPDESLGFGYATRSDDVFFVVQNLIDHGVVLRPAMGIQTTNLNEFSVKAVNERYGANKVPSGIYGVIIYNLINPETGEVQSEWAINQGLKELDVLVAFNEHIIRHNTDLHNAIREHKPGDIVRLMLIRQGQFMFLDYELTSLDFDSYIEYYDKRNTDLKEEKPAPAPEEEKEDKPVVTPAPEDSTPVQPQAIPPVEEEEVDPNISKP
jgi:S1-C subfamily serine protease